MARKTRTVTPPSAPSEPVDPMLWKARDFSARVLRPKRAMLEEAFMAVEGYEEPAEAWEALATRGIIPMGWVDHDARWFTAHEPPLELLPTGAGVPSQDDVNRYLRKGPALEPHPTSVAACVAVAGDPQGIVTAEALATESVRRLHPWGCPLPARVAWRCVAAEKWTSQSSDWRHMPVAHAVRDAYVSRRLPDLKNSLASVLDFGTPAWRAAYAIECDRMWKALAERSGTVSAQAVKEVAALGQPPIPADLVGRALASLPNPFEPLVALWTMGYALDAITTTAIVLIAPDES